MKFSGIFTGKALWAGKPKDERLIDRSAGLGVDEPSDCGATRRGQVPRGQTTQRLGGASARNAPNRDGGAARRARQGKQSVGHQPVGALP
jgi:hypothetical protein